jgi:hypothetical protein
MGSRKHKSGKSGIDAVQEDAPERETVAPAAITAAAVESESDSRWIMREAAWGRMFGRIEAKNPFSR